MDRSQGIVVALFCLSICLAGCGGGDEPIPGAPGGTSVQQQGLLHLNMSCEAFSIVCAQRAVAVEKFCEPRNPVGQCRDLEKLEIAKCSDTLSRAGCRDGVKLAAVTH